MSRSRLQRSKSDDLFTGKGRARVASVFGTFREAPARVANAFLYVGELLSSGANGIRDVGEALSNQCSACWRRHGHGVSPGSRGPRRRIPRLQRWMKGSRTVLSAIASRESSLGRSPAMLNHLF